MHNEVAKYEIYIGLKDRETLLEKYTIDDFASFLSKQFKNKKMGFSMNTQLGGYAHEKGYVTENSLRITLVGIEEDEVFELARIIKESVNTDAVLITNEVCECSFI